MRGYPIWSKEVSVFDWEHAATETCYVLEGEVKVTTPNGEEVEFRGRSGDLPARAEVHLRGARAVPQALSVHLGTGEGRPEGKKEGRDFALEDAYGNPFRPSDVKGPSGTLVMFICNHCPYVRAIADRIAQDALDLQKRGVSVVAVIRRTHPNR
jgi:hypothetical protein